MINERQELEKKMLAFEDYIASVVLHASAIAMHGAGYIGSSRRESEVSEARNKILDLIVTEGA